MGAYAWLLSQPFFGLFLVVVVEGSLSGSGICMVGEDTCTERLVLNSIISSIFIGCIASFILTFLSQIVVTGMDVCLFCYAVANDLGITSDDKKKQDFYESIKETVVVGLVVEGTPGAVVGQSPSGQAPPPPGTPAQAPVLAGVVGMPVVLGNFVQAVQAPQ